MQIVVLCPGCGNRYQLQEEMRGKKMRCNNAVCHEIFEIRDNGAPPPAASTGPAAKPADPPPTVAKSSTGYIGEMVPLVSVEAAEETPAPPAAGSGTVGGMVPLVSAEAAAPSWQQAPPPVRKPAAPTTPAAAPPAEPAPAPWQQAPPPVRKPAAPAPAAPTAAVPAPPPAVAPVPPPPAPAPPPAPTAPNWQAAAPPVRRANPKTPAPRAIPPTPAAAAPENFVKEATQTHRPAKKADTSKPKPAPTPPPGDAALQDTVPDAPREVSWTAVAPPPLRRPADATATMPAPDWSEPETEAPVAPAAAPATRRYGVWVVLAMLLVIGGIGGWLVFVGGPEGLTLERDTAATAKKDFEAGGADGYKRAQKAYEVLVASFPNSPDLPRYKFYAELSRLLADAHGVVFDPEEIMNRFRRFLGDWQKGDTGLALLEEAKDRLPHVLERAIQKRLSDQMKQMAEKTPNAADLQAAEAAIKQVIEWIKDNQRVWEEGQVPQLVTDDLGKLGQIVKGERDRQGYIEYLRRIVKPKLDDVDREEREARQRGYERDKDVRGELDRIRRSALPSVVYERRGVKIPAAVAEAIPSGLVLPRVGTWSEPLPSGQGVAFALARGVLYALAENDGRLLWATRVGIDTAHLPVRVAATETNPDLVLVLNSQTNTLTARTLLDGAPLWQLNLRAPCLGRPLLVERDIPQTAGGTRPSRRVYVATVDGRVQEIEIGTGTLLGEFNCGQDLRLLVGGTREPETGLLYFPADRNFVFVFDVAADPPQCVNVLRTGHPSGSLRSAPILVSSGLPTEPNASPGPRFLILSQAADLDRMKLRVWELPANLANFNEKPLAEQELPGWSWFEPFCDGEKIAIATDAGVLGLYGILQKGNRDEPALFPLLGKEHKEISLSPERTTIGRSQVIQATENDFWVLARTEAQHWRVGIDRRPPGLRIGPKWPRPVALGSPLHAGQTDATGKTLYAVTQSLASSTCLASAIDAATGEVRWQRQLGLVAGADPVVVNGQVIALDRAGSLFAFDPIQLPHRAGEEWQFVQERQVAGPPEAGDGGATQLLRAPDAVLAVSSGGDRLTVRRYTPGKKPGEGAVQEMSFPGALAGAPVLGGNALVYPAADGTLHRQPLSAKSSRADRGQQWRDAAGADADARGYVVALGENDFLCTDGSNGLHRIHWPAGPIWQKKELKLPALERIIAAPVVIPASEGKPLQVCVADRSGTLTLLQGEFLQKARSWKLPGSVTTGPFLAGKHIGVVVDRRTLVWIDPNAEQPVWEYTDLRREPIVGQPQRSGDRVLLAHLNGNLVSLDAEKGEMQGRGFNAGIAPAAAPAVFGADRVLLPLTDGTVLVLPLAEIVK